MSTMPAFIEESPTPDNVESSVHRHLGDCPDVLSNTYLFARRLPGAGVLLASWLHLHALRAGQLLTMDKVKVEASYLLLLCSVYKCWNCYFRDASNGVRAVPRTQFLISQGGSVLAAAVSCTLLMFAAKLLLWKGLFGIHLFGFLLQSAGCGFLCVLAAAALYEIAYQTILPNNCVIVGTRQRALDGFVRLMSHGERRGVVLGFVDNDRSHADRLPAPLLGKVRDLATILASNPVDLVYLALPLRSHYGEIQEAIRICERVGVRYICPPDLFQTRLESLRSTPLHDLQTTLRGAVDSRLLVKRGLDLALGSALLLAFVPFGLAIAALIKLTSEGPVFYVQPRYGKNRRVFRMYKFRSMVDRAEDLQHLLEDQNELRGPVFKIRCDSRVTRIGRLLRMSSLDEIPQLLNVIRGDMSLVGPRPMSLRDVRRFDDERLMQRFSVMPGMTGLWQVSGRSNLDFSTWTKLDVWYINNWSLGLDLKILLQTLPAVLASEGAV